VGELAIIVNGAPGAGKTSLAVRLQLELDIPLISKDAIKESLAEIANVPLPTSRVGAIASDAMWALVASIAEPAIVESFWFAGRDDEFFRRGLEVAGIRRGVEMWCEAPIETMRDRYLTRPRHFAHTDGDRLGDWERFASNAVPISSFPVIKVDTSNKVDVAHLAALIRSELGI